MEYLYKAGFWAHIVSSLAMVIAIILLVINYKKLIKLDGIELVKIFSVLAIALSSHSQGHINLETNYGYDPIRYFRI